MQSYLENKRKQVNMTLLILYCKIFSLSNRDLVIKLIHDIYCHCTLLILYIHIEFLFIALIPRKKYKFIIHVHIEKILP